MWIKSVRFVHNGHQYVSFRRADWRDVAQLLALLGAAAASMVW